MVHNVSREARTSDNDPLTVTTSWEFRRLLFQVCAAAAWSDEAISARERDVLARLAGALASSDEERRELNDSLLADLNRHAAMAAVAALQPHEKAHLFDTSLELLLADQRLGRPEVAFLAKLRRPCGVSWWGLQRRLLRASLRRRTTVFSPLVNALCAVALILICGLWFRWGSMRSAHPVEAAGHPAITVASRPAASEELGAEELFERVRRSVVSVQVMVGTRRECSGSGAAIGRDAAGRTYVLTNRHVVDCAEGRSADVVFEVLHDSGARFAAALDYRSRQHDLALLAVEGLGEFSRPVPLRPRAELRVGEAVYALGSPLSLRGSFTSGIVSALRKDRLQTDAGIGPGSSGGPLFDRRGQLCGVVTEGYDGSAIGLAIYADAVLEMLDARARPTLESTPKR